MEPGQFRLALMRVVVEPDHQIVALCPHRHLVGGTGIRILDSVLLEKTVDPNSGCGRM